MKNFFPLRLILPVELSCLIKKWWNFEQWQGQYNLDYWALPNTMFVKRAQHQGHTAGVTEGTTSVGRVVISRTASGAERDKKMEHQPHKAVGERWIWLRSLKQNRGGGGGRGGREEESYIRSIQCSVVVVISCMLAQWERFKIEEKKKKRDQNVAWPDHRISLSRKDTGSGKHLTRQA